MRLPTLLSTYLAAVLMPLLFLCTPLYAEENINTPDKDGVTPLMQAAYNGNIARVKELLAANAEVNTKSNNGYTALMTAADSGHADCVTMLLEAKAMVNIMAP